MQISVSGRAGRILNGIARYRAVSADAHDAPQWLRDLSLLPSEVLVGLFENVLGQAESAIVVTSHRLGVFRQARMEWIAFDSIGQLKGFDNKHPSELRVTTKDGSDFVLPIVAVDPKFNDAFQWMRFIDRVVEDRRK